MERMDYTNGTPFWEGSRSLDAGTEAKRGGLSKTISISIVLTGIALVATLIYALGGLAG